MCPCTMELEKSHALIMQKTMVLHLKLIFFLCPLFADTEYIDEYAVYCVNFYSTKKSNVTAVFLGFSLKIIIMTGLFFKDLILNFCLVFVF